LYRRADKGGPSVFSVDKHHIGLDRIKAGEAIMLGEVGRMSVKSTERRTRTGAGRCGMVRVETAAGVSRP
jgi:hypothetical protein